MNTSQQPIILNDLPPVPGIQGQELADYWYALLDQEQAARYQGYTARKMEKDRHIGGGPEYIEISSRCIRYRRIDLWLFNEARRRANTARKAA